ncbi:hypothetical protein VSH64_06615 [Amycolatopsis rhabdoformis]|uniref:LppP/LprE family lipoprotein n=1 Tax=Amycolatopsis rhabdoformis TaxID=1448059 RepID=A0ABZ1IDN7_9PSEU|nr:hypothetical protein [Amycolatopsis rhabdoformis]WSE31778.1 hypothetical protein VSH64_06615 [Amycolatopsis rhabdoformis]
MSFRHRFSVFVGAAVLVAAACGNPGAGSDDAGSTQSGDSSEVTTTGNPPTEGTGSETARSSERGPSVQLAGLPIGGSNDERGKDDCISVSLLTTPPEGVRVVVAEIHAGPAGQVRAGGQCGDYPACAAFTFSSQAPVCSVALTWLAPGSGATLTMSGSVDCNPSGCDGYRLEPNTIDLSNPLGEDSASTTSTESSTDTTDTTGTTADSSTSTTSG